MAGVKRTKNNDQVLIEAIDILKDVQTTLEEVISNDKPMTKICQDHNLDYMKVRKLIGMKLFRSIRIDGSLLQEPVVEDPYEELFKKVFWLQDLSDIKVPIDLKESIDYLIDTSLSEREKVIVNAVYGFVDEFKGIPTPLSLSEMGDIMNVSSTRIAQIEKKALRKLRHPARANILRDGLIKTKEKEEVRKYQIETEAKEMAQRVQSLMEEMQKTATDKLKDLNPDDISDIIDGFREIHISELDLSTRTYNSLYRWGVTTLYAVLEKSDEDLQKIRNLGMLSINELKESLDSFLEEYGLSADAVHTFINEYKKES